MPKPARHALIWSVERDVYVVCDEQQRNALSLRENDSAWFDWLASRTSFSFQGKHGHLNLLKETRSRGGEGYWYAYVRHGKHRFNRYVGRTPNLTIARLEALADTLRTYAGLTPPVRAVAKSLHNEIVLRPGVWGATEQ